MMMRRRGRDKKGGWVCDGIWRGLGWDRRVLAGWVRS